ncbi:Os01g0184350 [Oryza sativa Japonica Group]|uniref:Os01g0184350 protein n=1 Tax=Oryza sativa subsp. japonica TaxID=39947 RepID=A0A0P0UYY2_ORYSJ|nr:Os01g0184350 [Oryza sativa Japonica Group]
MCPAAAATFRVGFSGVKNWSANAAAAFPIFCGVAIPAAVLALFDGGGGDCYQVHYMYSLFVTMSPKPPNRRRPPIRK